MISLILGLGLWVPAGGMFALVRADNPPGIDLNGDPLPAGALVRLGTTRFRVSSSQKGLVFAADDRTLIVADNNRTIALLDITTGKRLREFPTGEQIVRAIRLSTDRRTLLAFAYEYLNDQTVTSPTLLRWNIETGEQLSKDSRPIVGPSSIFTRDGKTAISGTGNGFVVSADLAQIKESRRQKLDQGSVTALALSPDEKLVIAATSQGLHFWEWDTGNDPIKIEGGRPYIETLAFSPDGSILAEGSGAADLAVLLREVRSRKVLGKLTDNTDSRMNVHAIAFTADGRSVVAAGSMYSQDAANGTRAWSHGVFVWDVATHELRHGFKTGALEPFDMALSHDDHWLAVGSTGGIIKAWDLKSGQRIGDDLVGHEDEIGFIQFANDGKTIVTSSADSSIRVWNAASGAQQRTFGHDQRIAAAALSPDSRLIASSSLDDTVRLWDVATGKERHRFPGHGKLGGKRAVTFSTDGKRLVSWGDDFIRRIWDVETGKAVGEERPLPGGGEFAGSKNAPGGPFGLVTQSAFSANSRFLALGLGKRVGVFDVEFGRELEQYPLNDGLLISLALSPDGSRVATSAWGKPVQTRRPDGTGSSSAVKGHVARVHAIGSGDQLFEFALPDNGAGPLAFSADGKALAVAVGGAEPKIHILNSTTGAPLQVINGLPSKPRAVCFSKDGQRLACGLSDATALVWKLTGRP